MQTSKKKGKIDFAVHLQNIGRKTSGVIAELLSQEFVGKSAFPVRLVFDFRPGNQCDWDCDRLIVAHVRSNEGNYLEFIDEDDLDEIKWAEDAENEK